jgi:glutaconate CoA-transferase, subunit B
MGFDEETKRMQVEYLHPGVSFEQVQKNTGFEILQVDGVRETKPPGDDELRVLREEVDPHHYLIGRA